MHVYACAHTCMRLCAEHVQGSRTSSITKIYELQLPNMQTKCGYVVSRGKKNQGRRANDAVVETCFSEIENTTSPPESPNVAVCVSVSVLEHMHNCAFCRCIAVLSLSHCYKIR